MSGYSLLQAKQKLEALCAYQERCSFDLQRKMEQWGVDREDQDRLLAHLIENNFLNEERFAEAYVSGKLRIKRWGRFKIKQHLKQKFISDYSINKAINSIDEDLYLKNIEDLAEKKYASLRGADNYAKKAKIYRYLSGKGYENDLFIPIVERLFEH